jgi:7,8-dihydropterin-6-yl-methyl-4-(beta-D-ribofuranosyl)aminobenzene 5'-phosphate synthase
MQIESSWLKIINLAILFSISFSSGAAALANNSRALASEVQVTILSSNLANGPTIGEWGFSALVEADGRCILFDAGRYPDTVIKNAEVLNIDLSCVTDVVLSHFHFDHNSGLLPLIKTLHDETSAAIRRVHVAEGFFSSRRPTMKPGTFPTCMDGEQECNLMIALRADIEGEGVEFVVHSEATEIFPSVWISGPVKRRHPEMNYPTGASGSKLEVRVAGDWVDDSIPESQALVVRTQNGPIVLLGCGHSGVVNALIQIQETIQDDAIHALMGGLHLFSADDQTLGWTADRLREIGIENLMAGHCTGIEPLIRLRAGLNLNRRTAVVGAVGSSFVLDEGIRATSIAM